MKTRLVSALACALVSMMVMMVRQANADEVWFNPPFVSGKGSVDMFIRVSTDPSELRYVGDSSIGSYFAVDPYNKPGYLELRIEIPSMMWTGNLFIGDYDTPPIALGERMTVPSILMTGSTAFVVPSEGRFDIDAFHRRDDGIVDLLSGNFYQPHQQGSDVEYQYGHISFDIPCVPEPSATVLVLIGSAILIGKKHRQ